METITLDVKGMTCMGCVASVKRAIGAVAGVGNVDVALATGKVTVELDPQKTGAAQIEAAVTDAGYDVVH
jgi:copper ion binding protein